MARPELDERVLCDIIHKSTAAMFATMISLPLTLLPGDTPQPVVMQDITGMIGLAGALRGTFAVHFPAQVACRLVSAMLGTPVTALSPEVKDGVGEIANIIIGSAKTDFYALGFDYAISTPTVVVGRNYRVHSLGIDKHIRLVFSVDHDLFALECYLKQTI